MGWLQRAWPALRDVVILGLGVLIVLTELTLWAVRYRVPDPLLSGLAATLLGIPAASHIRALARGVPGSSSPSPPPPSPPSPPPGSPPAGIPGDA